MDTPTNPRQRARPALAAAACLTLAFALAACGGGGGGDEPGSKKLDLVIGNVLPLSGPSAALGRSGQKASSLARFQIRLAIDDSVADHRVRVIQADEGDSATAASAAAKQLTDSGADCLTGPWSAAAVEQTAGDVAIPAKTLEITPVPATDVVAELSDHDLVNSTSLPVSTEGTALADAIERALGGTDGRTVNVAMSDDDYGKTLAEDFAQEWRDRDGTVLQGLTSESPDATVAIGDPSDFSQLVSSLPRAGRDPTIAWGGDQLVNPGLPALVGSDAVTGMRALAPGAPRGRKRPRS